MSVRANTAIAAVRDAAKVIRRYDSHRGDLKIAEKKAGDLVTNADIAVEKIILEALLERYPDDGFLSEERGSHGDQANCWVLDPIDGTSNFVHGLPFYAISLAWCEDGVAKIGVVYDIVRDELFCAETGRGATCNGRRIRVSTTTKFSNSLILSTGASGAKDWRWDLLKEVSKASRGMRRTGSATLDLVLVAKGNCDGAIGSGISYWDYAAGELILNEAGGTMFRNIEVGKADKKDKSLGLFCFGTPRIANYLKKLAEKQKENW